MKVIGAGLPRTATTTQKIALEMLGLGPCYHMRDMMSDMEANVPLWRRAFDGESPWDEIFTGYNSSTDWPGAYFWRELIGRVVGAQHGRHDQPDLLRRLAHASPLEGAVCRRSGLGRMDGPHDRHELGGHRGLRRHRRRA